MTPKQRGLAKRIYNRLMDKGLIVYEPGSAEATKKIIIEEVMRK